VSTTKTQTSIKQRDVLDSLLIAYPNLLRKGWRQQIRLALPPLNDADGDAEEFNEFLDGFTLEPDAVAIDTDVRELIFFEVEVHSLMSDAKLKLYGKFAIDLIAFDIVFGLMTVNKHGHINAIDVLPHYVQWIKEVSK
jgi:hypothetical protein